MHLLYGGAQRAVKAGAYDVVLEAFQRCHELGLGVMSVRRYSIVLSALAAAGELETLLR